MLAASFHLHLSKRIHSMATNCADVTKITQGNVTTSSRVGRWYQLRLSKRAQGKVKGQQSVISQSAVEINNQ